MNFEIFIYFLIKTRRQGNPLFNSLFLNLIGYCDMLKSVNMLGMNSISVGLFREWRGKWHVGNALASVAHLISSTDVERRVIGRAGGAVSALPPCGFGGIGGSRRLRWRHRQWADNRAVQAGYTAGIAGKVLLRDGATVRPILLAAVVLQRESSPLHVQ